MPKTIIKERRLLSRMASIRGAVSHIGSKTVRGALIRIKAG